LPKLWPNCSLIVGTTAARNRKLEHELQPLKEGAYLIRTKLQSESVALLFGFEKRGLSNQDHSYCQWLLRFPTREPHPSMNLGQAVAACLYELVREFLQLRKRCDDWSAALVSLREDAPVWLGILRQML
jgi:tRNA C32,U32 (ribose-2'-O)-methylase TrmJ